ncbi:hypothetical protein AAC387_Pa02g3239 [Persea americana]
MMRHFFWSRNASVSKSNYVKWDTVTLPTEEGGLGIRKISEVNEAAFIKLGWQASTANSPWACWFKNRYFKDNSLWSPANSKYGSCIWRKIRRLAPRIQEGISWIVGNGQEINLLHDNWSAKTPFSVNFPHLNFPDDQRLGSLHQVDSWQIPSNLPPDISSQLSSAISLLSPTLSDKDIPSWKESPDGQLSLKAAWNLIRSRAPKLHWPSLIWNGFSHHTTCCFGWRLMHNRTPTELRLKRLGYSIASRCNLCCQEEDSADHLFFSCDLAISLWRWILSAASSQTPIPFFASSIWMSLTRGNDKEGTKIMAAIFLSVSPATWKARNATTFEHTPPTRIKTHLQEDISFTLQKVVKHFKSPQLRSIILQLGIPYRHLPQD